MIAKFTKLENSSNDIDAQKQYQRRREKYENPANLITVDRFVDDIEKYIPNLLPATVGNQKLSIVVAKNLFHWIKHPGDQPRGMNEFTEKLINIAVTNQKSLQTLVVDTNKFIKKLDSILLETYR